MTNQLGATPATAVQVVLATVAIYFTFVILLRVGGQRSLVALTGTDVACVISMGAVVGRTALLAVPTLATGVLALVVLFGIQRALATLARRPRFGQLLARAPVILMANGDLHVEAMRRARVTPAELRQCLRLAGITHRNQVRLAVLERGGGISVIRCGVELEPWLLDDLSLDDLPRR